MPRRNNSGPRKPKRSNKKRKFGPKNIREVDSYSEAKRKWDDVDDNWERYIREYEVEDLDGNENRNTIS